MARVTAEDCVEKVPNRFELVMLAAQRSREIAGGAALTVNRDNDKNPVVSLREIAEETVSLDELREELVRNYQMVVITDDVDDDMVELMDGEGEFAMPSAEAMAAEIQAAEAAQQRAARESEQAAEAAEREEEGF